MARIALGMRWRLGHLLFLILFAGMALGAERALSRRQACLERAAYHAAEEAKYQKAKGFLEAEVASRMLSYHAETCGNVRRLTDTFKEMLEDSRQRAEEHAWQKERFLRAASRPWENIPK